MLLVETLLSHTPLRMSWEDIAVVIAGPRVGKTTSNVVPAIAAYTGPVKTSSNKPDTHDAAREIRQPLGQVWLCDPQDLIGAPARHGCPGGPGFWWDPLADVTDLAVARELVQIMIDTTVDADAKPDAYFHPTGKATLVNYVLRRRWPARRCSTSTRGCPTCRTLRPPRSWPSVVPGRGRAAHVRAGQARPPA